MPTDVFTKLDPDILCEQTKELEDFLLERIINQQRAIKCVVSAYDKFNSPLWQLEKPILSALFLGPSGVGKTYIAEMLAEYFLDDPTAFTKIECANYVERHEISKLLGAPPGYIGYNELPILSQNNIELPAIQHAQMALMKTDKEAQRLSKEIEKARQNCLKSTNKLESNSLMQIYMQKIKEFQSYISEKTEDVPIISIILFDEIEKAHPEVFNILLQVLDEGRLTDAKGRVVNFRNTIIVLTSNIGSQFIEKMEAMGFSNNTGKDDYSEVKNKVTEALKDYFRPEFLNRLDDILVFDVLSRETIRQIVSIQIDLITKRLLEKEININIADEALEYLGKEGYNPSYGARPLKRLIQTSVLNPIASLIVSRAVIKGDTINVSIKDGKLNMGVKKPISRKKVLFKKEKSLAH